MPQPTAVSIGNFDGVHLGHVALMRAARGQVGPDGRVVAIAFDPHPASVLPGRTAPPPLTTFDRRAALLRQAGADEVVRLEPTLDVLRLHPENFLALVVERFSPGVFVEGQDFRFGRNRFGDITLLQAAGDVMGFSVLTVPSVDVELTDQTIVRASSTLARWLLNHGRIEDVAAVLGRPLRLKGPVQPGDQRGRTIGFPTANVGVTTALPGDGVYAARATLPDGSSRPAAVNIGRRPTFDNTRHLVEACLLDDRARPAPLDVGLYDWTLELDLLAWLRDQVRFPSLEALTGQLERDCARALDLCALTTGEPIA
ncbi:MAG: bifunctional riboflavin kinase/FAD synthetase [Leptolyngbya sp. PLA3]|nr:MAG: bifunctional riboflavin kinase/FAD synthetase [Cyanobacteria bacterium CYA]MCE7968032.1 bifunctional riboflavin kinase/FAD synthetase [Leptolyngbya sp. PL-A3]